MVILCNADAGTTCQVCYRCAQYSGGDCVSCVYDRNYCNLPAGQCHGQATWNMILGGCECNVLYPGSGKAWTFFDTSDDVCDDITISCVSGQFPGNIYICANCGSPDFNPENNLCIPRSDIKYASDAVIDATNMYNGCYLAAGCVGSDDTGTFEILQDCLYDFMN